MKKTIKVGRPAPEWLVKLKPGIYSIEELEKVSKRSKSTIRESLKLHGAQSIYQTKHGKIIAYYKWDGLKGF